MSILDLVNNNVHQENDINKYGNSYVLITAAAGGLGKAFAAECALRGWNLFLTDIRADLLHPLAAGLTHLYPVEVQTFPADLTQAADRDRLWHEVDRAGIRFHFIVNIAGIEYEGEFIHRSVEELRTIIRLNIEAGVEMTSRILHYRAELVPLYILNVSSMAGFYPMPLKAVYAASKRFIIDYSLALKEELVPLDVHVTVLCPNGMPTNERSINGLKRQGMIGQIIMENVGRVAYRAIQVTLAGRAIYIPGFVNRLIFVFSSLLPVSWKIRFIGRRWRRAHQKAAKPSDLTYIKKSNDNPTTHQ